LRWLNGSIVVAGRAWLCAAQSFSGHSMLHVARRAHKMRVQKKWSEHFMDIRLGDISHIIQLSIAPVFLLTGVGTKLTVLTNRLARIIDRSRALEERIKAAGDAADFGVESELHDLYRRAHLINRAITLSTSCGLLVCVVIAALFIGDALNLELAKFIALCFVIAMFSLIGSFVYLLREIFVAMGTMAGRRYVVKARTDSP